MKKSLFTLMLMAFVVFNGFAQDDDVYFVPSKKSGKTAVRAQVGTASTYEVIGSELEGDNWYEGRDCGRDVDEYNRRCTTADDEVTVVDDNVSEDIECCGNGTCTARIIRFRSPGAIIIASPWYWDYYDTYFYDPWYGYSWRSYYGLYRPWGWSWSIGWGHPYYGWSYGYYGWHRPYYGWHDPWRYNYGWGRHPRGYNNWAWRPVHHGPAYTDYRRGWGSGRDLGRGRSGRNNNFGLNNGRGGGRYGNSNSNSGRRLGGGTRTVDSGQRGRLGGSTIGTGSHSLGSRPTVNNNTNSRPVQNINSEPTFRGNSNNNNGRTGVTTGGSNRGRTFGGSSQTNKVSPSVNVHSSGNGSRSIGSPVTSSRHEGSVSTGGNSSGRSFGGSSSGSGRSFGSGSSSGSGRSFGGSSGGGRSFGGGSGSGGRGFGGRR